MFTLCSNTEPKLRLDRRWLCLGTLKQPCITLSKLEDGAKNDSTILRRYLNYLLLNYSLVQARSDRAVFKLALLETSATKSSRLWFTEEYSNLGRALQERIRPYLGTHNSSTNLPGTMPGLENPSRTTYLRSKWQYCMLPNSSNSHPLFRLPQHSVTLTQEVYCLPNLSLVYKAFKGVLNSNRVQY